MAIRFDAATDHLSRTASLPSRTSFTICGWGKRAVDTGAFAGIAILEGATGGIGIMLDAAGDNLLGAGYSQGTANLLTPGANWFFFAVTSGGGNPIAYAGLSGGALAVGTFSGLESFTPSLLRLGNSDGDLIPFNGSVAAVKIWEVALTQAEIELERGQYLPIRLLNLHLFSPFINTGGTSFLDISGNGRDWTETGTVTDEDGPPIPWKMGRHRILIPAAAAGGSSIVPVLMRLFRAQRI